jgi:hypothetical protein
MERQMTKVANQVKMEDEDYLDVLFWRSKSMAERLEEVTRLRKNYYTWLNGSFPEKMVKVITMRQKGIRQAKRFGRYCSPQETTKIIS